MWICCGMSRNLVCVLCQPVKWALVCVCCKWVHPTNLTYGIDFCLIDLHLIAGVLCSYQFFQQCSSHHVWLHNIFCYHRLKIHLLILQHLRAMWTSSEHYTSMMWNWTQRTKWVLCVTVPAITEKTCQRAMIQIVQSTWATLWLNILHISVLQETCQPL